MHTTLQSASLLSWYFCDGQTLFERSTCGSVLARGELFSRRTRVEHDPAHAVLSRTGRVLGYADCSVSCHPTDQGSAPEPPRWALERYGKVSRWLMDLEVLELQLRRSGALQLPTSSTGPVLGHALECEHGDLGAVWASVCAGRPGRRGSIYHLTQAGTRWLDVVARQGRGLAGLRPELRMLNEIATPRAGSGKAIERARREQGEARRAALAAIDLQAARLGAAAVMCWNAVVMETKTGRLVA